MSIIIQRKQLILIVFSLLIMQSSSFSQSKEIAENKNTDALAIGYQIGGLTLIGVDYELRVHDYFGVHAGLGFSGYTAGIKIHPSPKRNSSFLNLSFKDGGLQIDVIALEYGRLLRFNKKNNFGIHFQIGISKIVSITKEFENRLFRHSDTPPFLLSIGVGIGIGG